VEELDHRTLTGSMFVSGGSLVFIGSGAVELGKAQHGLLVLTGPRQGKGLTEVLTRRFSFPQVMSTSAPASAPPCTSRTMPPMRPDCTCVSGWLLRTPRSTRATNEGVSIRLVHRRYVRQTARDQTRGVRSAAWTCSCGLRQPASNRSARVCCCGSVAGTPGLRLWAKPCRVVMHGN
jgi:hypothetical protein